MKPTKYSINGETKKEQEEHCPCCNDGIEYEPLIQTNKNSNPYTEYICGTCNTLYKIPKKTLTYLEDTDKPIKITMTELIKMNTPELLLENIDLITLKTAYLLETQPQTIINQTKIKPDQPIKKQIQQIITQKNQDKQTTARLTPVQIKTDKNYTFRLTK